MFIFATILDTMGVTDVDNVTRAACRMYRVAELQSCVIWVKQPLLHNKE